MTTHINIIWNVLQLRPGSKVLPAPYVKVYLVSGKKCIVKAKTTTARKTLDPLYQQQLSFREPFAGCILQVSSSATTTTTNKIILLIAIYFFFRHSHI